MNAEINMDVGHIILNPSHVSLVRSLVCFGHHSICRGGSSSAPTGGGGVTLKGVVNGGWVDG